MGVSVNEDGIGRWTCQLCRRTHHVVVHTCPCQEVRGSNYQTRAAARATLPVRPEDRTAVLEARVTALEMSVTALLDGPRPSEGHDELRAALKELASTDHAFLQARNMASSRSSASVIRAADERERAMLRVLAWYHSHVASK